MLHLWTPPESPELSVCLLRRFAHLPCPGCGLTRAFAHLAKGEWTAAFRLHPLALPIAAEVGLLWGLWGLSLVRRRCPAPLRRIDALMLAHVLALVALWLGRLATGTLPL